MNVRKLINELLAMPMDSDIIVGTTKNCCHVTPISNNSDDISIIELSCYDRVYIAVKIKED